MDISTKFSTTRFNVRAAALVSDTTSNILVQRKVESNEPWALPGGKVRILEGSSSAIVRELEEEFLIVDVQPVYIGTFEHLVVVEERTLHQIVFLYQIVDYGGCISLQDDALEWKWVTSSDIHLVKPTWLSETLLQKSDHGIFGLA